MRTRFAPSPTGFMHLGGLRTALFNFLIARRTGGSFLLRIEDTDQSRTVPGAAEGLQDVLKWAGIPPDAHELVVVQSSKLKVYQSYAQELISMGRAYRCYCSKGRLESLRAAGHTGYDRACRNRPHTKAEQPHVIRLRVPDEPPRITFHDKIYGHISISTSELDDVILMKADGFPTYHFANVIDDHESSIDLVMRGQEWLPSTPLHALLYDTFNWPRPLFAHLPLLVKADGTKLSKRHGDAFVQYYRRLGYEPEALVNFVAFLGWNPKENAKEVMGMDELISAFSLDGINKSESRVDLNKLNWLNRRHIGLIESNDSMRLVNELRSFLRKDNFSPGTVFDPRVLEDEYLAKVIHLIMDRIHLLSDIPRLCSYFFKTPPVSESIDLDKEALSSVTGTLLRTLDGSDFNADFLKRCIDVVKKEHNEIPSTTIMMAIRLAITGTHVGASVIDTMVLLGPTECTHRLSSNMRIL